jgi:DinB family protein
LVQTPTKRELLDALLATGDGAVARLRAIDPASFQSGRYEGGWNGRQILAHVAAIEWTYARLIDVARQAPAEASPRTAPASAEVRRTTPEESAGVATRPVRGGIDDYNARQVEKRAGATVAELLDEFAANRAKTIAAVEATEEELLVTPIRSAGGITGPLASVIRAVAVQHVMMHVADITGEPWQEQRW